MSRRALVLGCGGVAGAAWTTATLEVLEQRLNWDAREADYLLGTSAGAIVATLLGAKVSVADLVRSQQGESDCALWNHDRDSGGAWPPQPRWQPTAPKAVWQRLVKHRQPVAAISGLLPQGTLDMSRFRALIDHFIPDRGWPPHPATWVIAAEVQSLQRTVFGRADAPVAAARDAVCASYGVPGWCPPVRIGEVTYIDGGVRSPTSADLLINEDVQEVIVLAPMTTQAKSATRNPLVRLERLFRQHMTGILDDECQRLQRAGKRVIRLEPTATDLQAIGYNMMDPRRRQQVFQTARATAPANVEYALQRSCTH